MSRKLTEGEVEQLLHSVAHKVLKKPYREAALVKFAESIKPADAIHLSDDAKKLELMATSYFRDYSAIHHWELRKEFRDEHVSFADELRRAELAGWM